MFTDGQLSDKQKSNLSRIHYDNVNGRYNSNYIKNTIKYTDNINNIINQRPLVSGTIHTASLLKLSASLMAGANFANTDMDFKFSNKQYVPITFITKDTNFFETGSNTDFKLIFKSYITALSQTFSPQ